MIQISDLQGRLVALGHDLGTSGPKRDGVDGVLGQRTLEALWTELLRSSNVVALSATAWTEMVDEQLLKVACPDMPVAMRVEWARAIRRACEASVINTPRRIAAFIGQMAHESLCFVRTEENLNYSAARMAQVWARFAANPAAAPLQRVPNQLARSLERKPEALANHVYANRLGNGGPESGDGWRFRGGGPLQVTGRDNWTAFAKHIGRSLDDALAYGRTLEGGVMAAAWFWEENDVNRLADTPGVSDETKRINGGQIGLEARRKLFDRLVEAMLEREKLA
jgi:putative chitinase